MYSGGFVLPDYGLERFCGAVHIGIKYDIYDNNLDDLVSGMLDEMVETNNIAWATATYALSDATVCTDWALKKCES